MSPSDSVNTSFVPTFTDDRVPFAPLDTTISDIRYNLLRNAWLRWIRYLNARALSFYLQKRVLFFIDLSLVVTEKDLLMFYYLYLNGIPKKMIYICLGNLDKWNSAFIIRVLFYFSLKYFCFVSESILRRKYRVASSHSSMRWNYVRTTKSLANDVWVTVLFLIF